MNNHERIYDKIRALLAKAESTEYPDEAAVYTAKAQELIATHAIDMALLQEREGKGHVVTRILNIARPYPCLLYTSPSPRDQRGSRMPSSA